ncbi:type IV pilin [Haloterrigena gelatinilytica]|uniref:type IV pilin n=1 Tax=Haloterrigena gelatinilytica TaxID=2741724 RepID=UPI0028127FC4|nr:type IV pilin [Haloterrigena gelatinilytica]
MSKRPKIRDYLHHSSTRRIDDRAVNPLVGSLLLVAVTVLLATAVTLGAGMWTLESGGPIATFELTADSNESEITIDHVGGDPIDVAELSMTVAIGGKELTHQPPVPFVGAKGFNGTPTGPFNAAADSEWRVGERGSIAVAETNDPELERGESVTVILAVDERRIATLETTVN